MMAGDVSKNITLKVDDNFHRVYTVDPVHLPEIDNKCDENNSDECTLNSITVTQNMYEILDDFDTGF